MAFRNGRRSCALCDTDHVVAGDSISLSKIRIGVELDGTRDGINWAFTTPEKFKHITNVSIAVFRNGIRLNFGDDYLLSESDGAGTGWDVVVISDNPPLPFEQLIADYIAA